MPFEIEGHTLRVSFKSGIARYAGAGEDGNTLVQRAEAALKQAKASGEQYLHYQIADAQRARGAPVARASAARRAR